MPSPQRPISPHLQIYRPQITSVLSILHRITGVFLGLAATIPLIWIGAIISGPESYATVSAFANSYFGTFIILGFCFCLYYHLFNGIRHLIWDAGYALSLKAITLTGWLTLLTSLAATLLTWQILWG